MQSETVRCNGKKDALDKLREAISKTRSGEVAEPSKMTVGQLFDMWIDAGAPGQRTRKATTERTRDRYRDIFNGHVRPALGDHKVQRLQSTQIDKLYAQLGSKTSEMTGRPLASMTLRHIHVVFGAVLNYAVRKGILIANPQKKIEVVPTGESRLGIALTGEELGKLLAGFRGRSSYPIIALLAATGSRRNEALALRWSDLDTEKRELKIERAWEPSKKHGMQLKPPKTRRGFRTISLDPATVAMLVKHREMYLKIVAGVGDDVTADGVINLSLAKAKLPVDALIFPAAPAAGKDLDFNRWTDPRNLTRKFSKRAAQLGFPGFTLHMLRHTHTTALLDAGVPVHQVAARIGDSPEVLLKVYAQLSKKKNDAMEAAVNALATSILCPN
jgi:integrase